ncbi:MAG: EAL domain-containing protein [Alphaproteobacteria bacterium]|nr:EAL domain-containing protein [Alphaproteobacteria bacterium]
MAKQQIILSEKYLLSALDRIAKNPSGYAVLYISASKLKPKHRHPKFLKILEKFFDGVVGLATGVFFPLSNGDFAILGRGFSQAVIDEAVEKLREGTSNDPILHGKKSSDFAAVLNFPERFASFYGFIANMVENGQTSNLQENLEPEAKPLEAGDVDQVLNILEQVDISELVKRQSVIQIKGANQFKIDMQEFFVAVKDLNQQFDGLDLQANRWLYFYILQTLDKRMLNAFFSAKLRQWPEFIGVNLSLKSVYSQEFIEFAKFFQEQNKKIVVEVQLTDIFNNLSLYFEVKEVLARGGHKILIDGVSTSSLKFLNAKSLNPNMIKLFWEPLWEFCPDNEDVKAIVSEFGKENLILAKCDSSQSLSWGIRHGFNLFQGPFMDNLEVAMIRQSCPDAAHCTVKDCLKRKRLLSGPEHEYCTQKNILEKLL